MEQSRLRLVFESTTINGLAMTTPPTAQRVPMNTDDDVNRRIRRETETRLAYFAAHPDEIADRLQELDREWDIERAIEANASTLAFAGVFLGTTTSRKWLALSALVTAFLFQHAMQGWCPPVPVLRRLGFRTATEIEQERYALKALRGDFDRLQQAKDKLEAILQAVGLRRGDQQRGGAGATPT